MAKSRREGRRWGKLGQSAEGGDKHSQDEKENMWTFDKINTSRTSAICGEGGGGVLSTPQAC